MDEISVYEMMHALITDGPLPEGQLEKLGEMLCGIAEGGAEDPAWVKIAPLARSRYLRLYGHTFDAYAQMLETVPGGQLDELIFARQCLEKCRTLPELEFAMQALQTAFNNHLEGLNEARERAESAEADFLRDEHANRHLLMAARNIILGSVEDVLEMVQRMQDSDVCPHAMVDQLLWRAAQDCDDDDYLSMVRIWFLAPTESNAEKEAVRRLKGMTVPTDLEALVAH